MLLAGGTAHFSTGLKGRNMTLHRNKVKAYVSEMPWRAYLEVLDVTTTTGGTVPKMIADGIQCNKLLLLDDPPACTT